MHFPKGPVLKISLRQVFFGLALGVHIFTLQPPPCCCLLFPSALSKWCPLICDTTSFATVNWQKYIPVLQWKPILNTGRTALPSALCMYQNLFLLRKIWRNTWPIFTCLLQEWLADESRRGAREPFHTGYCCYIRSWKIKHCCFFSAIIQLISKFWM